MGVIEATHTKFRWPRPFHIVLAVLVTAIHVFDFVRALQAWMAGTNPTMTNIDYDSWYHIRSAIAAMTG
jgi:hypothetical protein